MSNGSPERESEQDVQCRNCGRFYHRQGAQKHIENCDYPEWADPLVPIEVEDERPPAPGEIDESDTTGVESTTAPESTAEPSAGVEADTTGGETTATDGGTSGLGLSGPPTPSGAVEDEPDEDADDAADEFACPNCGEPAGGTRAELQEEFGDSADCLECGETVDLSGGSR
jgi:predicted RNA-binding Zn-ribbon protein involved in translation (DUF1610 family)